METWIIADRVALGKYCGSKFKPAKIPDWPDLEAVSKTEIFKALDKATAECGDRKYAKGKVSFELLGLINPIIIKQKFPECQRLFDFLTNPKIDR